MPQNQPLSRYSVTLYHRDLKTEAKYNPMAADPDEAVKIAVHNMSMMFPLWFPSRFDVVKVVLVGIVLLLAACSTSTKPSLTCEDRFNRGLERGESYTQLLGQYTECLRLRGDTVTVGQVRGR